MWECTLLALVCVCVCVCVYFQLSVRLQGISLFIVRGVKALTETLQLQKGDFCFHSPSNPLPISDASQPPNPIPVSPFPHMYFHLINP